MSVQISIDPISHKKLNKRFKTLSKAYPNEMYQAIVAILFDMKLIAQKKIKADGHIVTSRLRNSLFVQTPKQKYANRVTNKISYTFQGGSGIRKMRIRLREGEAAFGTNVEYAKYIEKLDSFIEYASKKVNVNKRFQQAVKRAEKK